MSVKLSAYVWDGCAAAGIKGNKLLIMLRLADFSSDEGIAYPSIATIARQIGAGRSTVITALGELEKAGWLTKRERRQGQRSTSNLYTLNVSKLRRAAEGAYSHSPKSGHSETEHSNSVRPEAGPPETERPENLIKPSSEGPETGHDPSVNSKPDPSDNKTSCPVAAQPDQTDPAQLVLNHFNQVTDSTYGRGGRLKSVMGFINGRLADIFSADDLMLVTDYATAKWLNDGKMRDYLRPKTLFSPENFPEYFEKAKKWHAAGRPACVNGKWETASGAGFKASYDKDSYQGIPPGFRGAHGNTVVTLNQRGEQEFQTIPDGFRG